MHPGRSTAPSLIDIDKLFVLPVSHLNTGDFRFHIAWAVWIDF